MYVYISQSTLKQACRKTVVFPGFSLTILHTDTTPVSPSSGSDDTMSCATLLREVGLPETWCTHPTHLEVIHILDMSTLPLIWLSPIHCSLYPIPYYAIHSTVRNVLYFIILFQFFKVGARDKFALLPVSYASIGTQT